MSELGSKKYEMTEETKVIDGHIVHRIRALKDVHSHHVNRGDLGGWIEDYDTLSQDGDCWVDEDAIVYGDSYIMDNAVVYGKAKVKDTQMWDSALVGGNVIVQEAILGDQCTIYGNANISGSMSNEYRSCRILGHSEIYGDARITQGTFCDGSIGHNALIRSNADYLFIATTYGVITFYTDKKDRVRYTFQDGYIFSERTIDEFDRLFDDDMINLLFEKDDTDSITSYKLFCQQLEPVVKQYFHIS